MPSVASSLRRLRRVNQVLVLQADPELAADVPSNERSRAVRASSAPVRVFSLGEWQFESAPERTSLGALILVGMVVLRMEFGGCSHLEVLGKGDVLNPWQLETDTRLQEEVSVHVVQSGYVALLDRRFAEHMTPWPEVFAALMRRQIRRTRRMVLQAYILSRSRVEERLELMLWRLGEQFGSMTREGLLVRLPFTHLQLAEKIAARRSTVTMAVSRLVAEDRLRRPGRNQWLLPHLELSRLTALGAEWQIPA
jgi:CRP/FNR family transcriptional regulator, cyclic AMP receptor protein